MGRRVEELAGFLNLQHPYVLDTEVSVGHESTGL